MATVTVVVLVGNEERSISRCLTSFEGAFDEVLLVDTGATDKTCIIAAETCAKAKIVRFPWSGSFADARNRAILESSGDWIVFVDADEWFGDGGAIKLVEYLASLDVSGEITKGYAFRMLDTPSGKYHTSVGRAFPRNAGFEYKGSVHELLWDSGNKGPVNCSIIPSVFLYHDGYDAQLVDQMNKEGRNWVLLQELIDDEDLAIWGLRFVFRDHLHRVDDDWVEEKIIGAIDTRSPNEWVDECVELLVVGILEQRRISLARRILAGAISEKVQELDLTALLETMIGVEQRKKESRQELAALLRLYGERVLFGEDYIHLHAVILDEMQKLVAQAGLPSAYLSDAVRRMKHDG